MRNFIIFISALLSVVVLTAACDSTVKKTGSAPALIDSSSIQPVKDTVTDSFQVGFLSRWAINAFIPAFIPV